MADGSLQQRGLALLGLVFVTAAVFVLDRLSFAVRQSAAQSFNFVPAVLLGSLANLALALAVLALATWISTRAARDPLVAALYLTAGLLIVLFPVLGVAFGVPGAAADLLRALMPETRLAFTGGFLAAAGFLNLAQQRRHRAGQPAAPPRG